MENNQLNNPVTNTQESLEEKIARLENENAVLKIAHQELLNQLVEAQQLGQFDGPTGLRRRDFFMQEMNDYFKMAEDPSGLETEHRKNKIEMPTVSLVVFDIDKFKNVNDTLGHSAGDAVLKVVAETIQKYTREKDLTARWGGEEMVLVMIGADEEVATTKANFIREKISQIKFPDFPNLQVTISAGVASSDKFKKFDDLFNAADKAVYESKNSGRNKVTAHSKTFE